MTAFMRITRVPKSETEIAFVLHYDPLLDDWPAVEAMVLKEGRRQMHEIERRFNGGLTNAEKQELTPQSN